MRQDPRISVVVPVYQQWDLVSRLMECLDKQSLPAEQFEVILAMDGPIAPGVSFDRARIVQSEGVGSYAARNAGAGVAEGEWIVFTDADCRPQPDWLANLVPPAGQRQDLILAGRVTVVSASQEANPFETYELIRGIPQDQYVSRGYGATANLAVPRQIFQALGGFDPGRLSGGDAEFCRRASALGLAEVRYVEEAVVEHPARTSWSAIARKARRLKGGQISAGSASRRLVWVVRTLLPPLRAIYRFMRATKYSLADRVTACAIQLGLWLVEILETIRLLAGGAPERR